MRNHEPTSSARESWETFSGLGNYNQQKAIYLSYTGKDIGKYRTDYLVEDEVRVELKGRRNHALDL